MNPITGVKEVLSTLTLTDNQRLLCVFQSNLSYILYTKRVHLFIILKLSAFHPLGMGYDLDVFQPASFVFYLFFNTSYMMLIS